MRLLKKFFSSWNNALLYSLAIWGGVYLLGSYVWGKEVVESFQALATSQISAEELAEGFLIVRRNILLIILVESSCIALFSTLSFHLETRRLQAQRDKTL